MTCRMLCNWWSRPTPLNGHSAGQRSYWRRRLDFIINPNYFRGEGLLGCVPIPSLPLISAAPCWAGARELSFQSLCQVPHPGLLPRGISASPLMWGSGSGPCSLVRFSLEVKGSEHRLGQHSAAKGWSQPPVLQVGKRGLPCVLPRGPCGPCGLEPWWPPPSFPLMPVPWDHLPHKLPAPRSLAWVLLGGGRGKRT